MDTATWQPSLLTATDAPEHAEVSTPHGARGSGRASVTSRSFDRLERHVLVHGAWLDHLPAWLPGADELFEVVLHGLAWREGTERIRGAEVARPRLTSARRVGDLDGDLAVFARAGEVLSERYGVAFERVGVNLYRDGRDSVAWHGDRIARDLPTATIAIVSLGQARPFKARPAEGGASLTFELGHGDLLVMGGSFQRTWRHAVPKVARAGPRISVTYRHAYPPTPRRG